MIEEVGGSKGGGEADGVSDVGLGRRAAATRTCGRDVILAKAYVRGGEEGRDQGGDRGRAEKLPKAEKSTLDAAGLIAMPSHTRCSHG